MSTHRLALLVSALLSICLAACGGSSTTPQSAAKPTGVQHGSLVVDGLKRTYRLYVPPSLDPEKPVPLVVLLHWSDSTGDEMAATRYDDQAKTSGFIAVYPDGFGGSWNLNCCEPLDDVKFISHLLDQLTTDYRIDKTRVFAAGLSNGAILAYMLACNLSDRFAAIASVAGAMWFDDCRPTRPVSIMAVHGTADTTVLLGKPGQRYTAADAVQRWVTLDGCPAKPKQTSKGLAKTSTWVGCHGGTEVRLDVVAGGIHDWYLDDPSEPGWRAGEPDSTKSTWDFFKNSAPRL